MPSYILYPESFNQLRKVLERDHEDLWAKVGYYMAFDQAEFIELMNAELLCFVLPEDGIDANCQKFLKELATRKGKPATKSLELIHKEATNFKMFGTEDDDLARADMHKHLTRKGELN